MRALLFATTALTSLVAVGSAGAADMPVKARPFAEVRNWTGFYVGLNAGFAWGRSSAETLVDCGPPGSGLLPYMCDPTGVGAANAAAVNASGTGTINASGFAGGVQAGYNWQNDNLVVGLEIDFGALRLKGSRQGSGIYPVGFGLIAGGGNAYAVGSSFDTDWLATFRGRVGWTIMPNLLAYGTGGLALTRLTVANSFSDNVNAAINGVVIPGAFESASESKLKTGWVIGAGLEWAQSSDWTIKAEYLYIDFGKVTATGLITHPFPPGYGQGISTSSDLTAQVARIGINRRF
jgi:outer membrane immunogenic protein